MHPRLRRYFKGGNPHRSMSTPPVAPLEMPSTLGALSIFKDIQRLSRFSHAVEKVMKIPCQFLGILSASLVFHVL